MTNRQDSGGAPGGPPASPAPSSNSEIVTDQLGRVNESVTQQIYTSPSTGHDPCGRRTGRSSHHEGRLGSKYRGVVPSILDVLGYVSAAPAGIGSYVNAVPGVLNHRMAPWHLASVRLRGCELAAGRRWESLQAYTVEQVAEILNVGRDKVYFLLRTGQLRSIKIGKLRRITDEHLADFIASLEEVI